MRYFDTQAEMKEAEAKTRREKIATALMAPMLTLLAQTEVEVKGLKADPNEIAAAAALYALKAADTLIVALDKK